MFYASRGSGHVPARLDGEVTAVGRITSLGQVHPAGVPVGSAVGGLSPGGFANTYDIRPLWNRGDLGQGQTIVFFEVDGYSPADLATYAARFGLPAFPSPLPHIGPDTQGGRRKRHGPRGGPRDRARRQPWST